MRAQIVIEWDRAEPNAASGVILANAESYMNAERDRTMDFHFPNLMPTAYGAQLARAFRAPCEQRRPSGRGHGQQSHASDCHAYRRSRGRHDRAVALAYADVALTVLAEEGRLGHAHLFLLKPSIPRSSPVAPGKSVPRCTPGSRAWSTHGAPARINAHNRQQGWNATPPPSPDRRSGSRSVRFR